MRLSVLAGIFDALRRTGQNHPMDPRGAAGGKCLHARVEGGSGGHHVVNEKDRSSADERIAVLAA